MARDADGIGDVGQGAREEVDFQPGSSLGGENYGWRLREGFIQTPGSVGGPKPAGAIDPVYDYQRPGASGVDPNFTGTTIFGGVPYRGPDPELQGFYFFGDTSVNRLWMLKPATETTPQVVEYITPQLPTDVGTPSSPVAITEDAQFQRKLIDAQHIDRLNLGPIPTIRLDWLQPHEGNIVEFLFRPRAFQTAVAV